jgi:ribose 5-phosphate isomerase B
MKLVIGCDEAAFELKEVIKEYLVQKGIEIEDYGTYGADEKVLYPDVAIKVAQSVSEGKYERGILLCGTGIGMAISANKVPGIRAAVCHDVYSTERSRKSNDAQIMCMGARVIGAELAKSLVDTWLNCDFAGGGSKDKVDKIAEYEHCFISKC